MVHSLNPRGETKHSLKLTGNLSRLQRESRFLSLVPDDPCDPLIPRSPAPCAPVPLWVQGSYEVLKHYGNLSSTSTGFMLAEKDDRRGPTIVVGFGVGFTASAGIMNYSN